MKPGLLLRIILFTILLPGTVVVYLPRAIMGGSIDTSRLVLSPLSLAAGVLGVLGCTVVASCMWVFGSRGEGTPAPVDPPKRLVVVGAYRFCRNPMYLGVLSILVSEALLFGATSLWVYAGLVLLVFHLFVVSYEEPHLRRLFGEQYEEYCRGVPRWGISRRPFVSGREIR